MSIFWCKNVFCTRYENLLFTEKNIYNYSGFYQALSAINVYEIFLASVFKSYSIKWRPSKTKIAMWKSIPITHCVIYHHQKAKRIFCNAKFIEGPEPPDGSNDRTLFRVLSDGVLFRILSDKVFFRILRGKIFLFTLFIQRHVHT